MADKGHYRRAGGTRQGIYVCSPSGILLSSINSLKPDDVLTMINRFDTEYPHFLIEIFNDFSLKARHR